jgi:toxin ParE1/3/4
MSFRLSPEAEADIEQIVLDRRYNPIAARRWSVEIHRRLERLGQMPRIGALRAEVRPDLRTLPFGSYLMLYREIGDGVEVVRVIHGGRQWQDLL